MLGKLCNQDHGKPRGLHDAQRAFACRAFIHGYMAFSQEILIELQQQEDDIAEGLDPAPIDWDAVWAAVRATGPDIWYGSVREWGTEGIRIHFARHVHEAYDRRTSWKLLKGAHHAVPTRGSRSGLPLPLLSDMLYVISARSKHLVKRITGFLAIRSLCAASHLWSAFVVGRQHGFACTRSGRQNASPCTRAGRGHVQARANRRCERCAAMGSGACAKC